MKEPAGHFLSGADLGECAVPRGVQVDLEGFFLGAVYGLTERRFHGYHPTHCSDAR